MIDNCEVLQNTYCHHTFGDALQTTCMVSPPIRSNYQGQYIFRIQWLTDVTGQGIIYQLTSYQLLWCQLLSLVLDIQSIRHRSYYFYSHHTILCGFYSRAATIHEWHLLNSVVLVKSFLNVRALRWHQFYKVNKELRCSDWVCRCQGVNPKRHFHACHCKGYRARGIRPLRRCWRGQRWFGGEWTCSGGLLIHYTVFYNP